MQPLEIRQKAQIQPLYIRENAPQNPIPKPPQTTSKINRSLADRPNYLEPLQKHLKSTLFKITRLTAIDRTQQPRYTQIMPNQKHFHEIARNRALYELIQETAKPNSAWQKALNLLSKAKKFGATHDQVWQAVTVGEKAHPKNHDQLPNQALIAEWAKDKEFGGYPYHNVKVKAEGLDQNDNTQTETPQSPQSGRYRLSFLVDSFDTAKDLEQELKNRLQNEYMRESTDVVEGSEHTYQVPQESKV